MVTDDYDFWLLDLDGTLVDVEESYVHEVCGRVGDRLGVDFTPDEREALWYGIGDRRGRVFEAYDLDGGRFWQVFHEEEDPQARAKATYLHEDAAVVADLDRPTAVVTHCQPYLTDPVLDRLDIRDWFDAVICCSDEIGWKPDPEPVRRAMAAIGVDDPRMAADGGSHCGVLVGDSAADVGAAWNAGLDAAHVERHGPEKRGRCVRGDYRVNGLDELF